MADDQQNRLEDITCPTCGVVFKRSTLDRTLNIFKKPSRITPVSQLEYRQCCICQNDAKMQQCPEVLSELYGRLSSRIEELKECDEGKYFQEAMAFLRAEEAVHSQIPGLKTSKLGGKIRGDLIKEVELFLQKTKEAERWIAEEKKKEEELARQKKEEEVLQNKIYEKLKKREDEENFRLEEVRLKKEELRKSIVGTLLSPVIFLVNTIKFASKSTFSFVMVLNLVMSTISSLEISIKITAEIMYYIVKWRYWTHQLWSWAFDLLNIQIPQIISSILTHSLFIILIGITSSVRFVKVMDGIKGKIKRYFLINKDVDISDTDVDSVGNNNNSGNSVFIYSYLLIFYSSVYGSIYDSLNDKHIGSLNLPIDIRLVEFAIGAIVVVVMALSIAASHVISNKDYLRERLKTFLTLLVLILMANYISIYAEDIRGVLRYLLGPPSISR